ncbi:uncharacterized protein MELLADRAFT_92296 [Melampsora larici-populina 98AG31]|uniref:Uncharacterized protein n=1 Tax=Melampsora larici-populina (strain 98AG31 / pathotype 3-4-7) TaxID=747676 RepID=F4R937_MELLP|nr:uncharacterized protein MELLADRAFT_92296 [Melampsora larici-populina 98AG31]EGG10917.1 hypothetical protein MELLADRAFT_92296 [Melampsora larici-populina 98AG31]
MGAFKISSTIGTQSQPSTGRPYEVCSLVHSPTASGQAKQKMTIFIWESFDIGTPKFPQKASFMDDQRPSQQTNFPLIHLKINTLTRTMGNTKKSTVTAPSYQIRRIDNLIRTSPRPVRTRYQALMGQAMGRAPLSNPAFTPLFTSGSTLSPPLEAPHIPRDSTFIPPPGIPFHPFANRTPLTSECAKFCPPSLTATCSQSSVTSNPHINPFIFEASKHTSASSSTACTPMTTAADLINRGSPHKRPAPIDTTEDTAEDNDDDVTFLMTDLRQL